MKRHPTRVMRLWSASAGLCAALGAGCATTSESVNAAANAGVDPDNGESVATAEARVSFAKAADTYQSSKGKDVASARAGFEAAAKADPQFALARYNAAVLLEKEGKADDAKRMYREALEIDPTLDVATNNLGVILERGGQLDAARTLYGEIIDKHPEAVAARLRMASLARADGDPKTAARLAREALQFDASSLTAYRLLARIYAEENRSQLARLIAVRGSKLSPDDPELNFALALVAANDKDVVAARTLLSKVIEKDQNHVDARVALANMALSNRDWKTASLQLEALSKLDPKNPSVWNNLGLAYKGHGRFEEAKGAYQKALEVAPSFAEASLNLGLLQLRHLQDPDAALVTLTAYMDKASSPVSAADDLLTEAKTLIESRAEEKRMLAEQARMEEEMRKQAAEAEKAAAEAEKAAAAAGPADSAAPADGAAVSEAAPDAEAAAEPEAEPEPEPEPKDEPKAKKKTKKKKKPTKKPDGPARDDNFYD